MTACVGGGFLLVVLFLLVRSAALVEVRERDVPATPVAAILPPNGLATVSDGHTPQSSFATVETLATYAANATADALRRVGGANLPVTLSLSAKGEIPDTLYGTVRTRLAWERRPAGVAPDEPPSVVPPLEPWEWGQDAVVTPKTTPRDLVPDTLGTTPSKALGEDVETSGAPLAGASVEMSWAEGKQRLVDQWKGPLRSGTFTARLSGPAGTAVVKAALDEKSWLDNQPALTSDGYIVARLTQPAGSPEEARRQVRDAAVVEMTNRVLAVLASTFPADAAAVPLRDVQAAARRALDAPTSLKDDGLIRVDHPYGSVWYTAEFRDARTPWLEPIAAGLIAATGARERGFVC